MTYSGDVYTYRSTERPVRTARPAGRAPRQESGDRPREAGGGAQVDRLQESVARLEETVAHLSALVGELTVLWESSRALPQAALPPAGLAPAPPVRPVRETVSAPQGTPTAEPAPVYRSAPDADVQRQSSARPAVTGADVKVSLFPGGGTTAMVGQPRIIDA